VDHRLRRNRLVPRLSALGLDAFLVTRLQNVRYLTGFTGSNGQLLLAAADAVLFSDFRYEEQSRHEVPDLRREIYPVDFPKAFASAAADLGVQKVGFEIDGLTFRQHRDLAEAAPDVELVPLENEVEHLRWVKDDDERALIARAQAICDEVFEKVTGKLTEGLTEHQLAVELELTMRQLGGDGLAFDTIAAFGENAAEPHHHPTDRSLRVGDLVKLDFGCVVEGYHSDMTRTAAFGEPDPELREVYEVVRRAQAAGRHAVRAGVTGKEADAAARNVIRDAGYGENFGHSLGHGVGLEIHEGPTLRSTSEDILPAGTVVTVEPGIYLPGKGGVRIEDMVVVTEEGCDTMPATTHDLLVL
jgi:Xaa-Pro aminopeptidase